MNDPSFDVDAVLNRSVFLRFFGASTMNAGVGAPLSLIALPLTAPPSLRSTTVTVPAPVSKGKRAYHLRAPVLGDRGDIAVRWQPAGNSMA